MLAVTTPLQNARELRAGDEVRISGVIYTARDAAHQRLVKLVEEGKPLPFPVDGAVIYYVGPAPAKPGEPSGSAGPTTSMRMDGLTIPFWNRPEGYDWQRARSPEVIEAMKKHGAVYFAAVGGAAALIAQSIKAGEVVAYPNWGRKRCTVWLWKTSQPWWPSTVRVTTYTSRE